MQEKERLIQLFVTDLEKIVTEVDPSFWRDAIRQLYRTYVKRGSKEQGARDVPDRCVCMYVCMYVCACKLTSPDRMYVCMHACMRICACNSNI